MPMMCQALYQTLQICCLSFRSHDHPLKLVLLLSHCSESQKDLKPLLGGGVYDAVRVMLPQCAGFMLLWLSAELLHRLNPTNRQGT